MIDHQLHQRWETVQPQIEGVCPEIQETPNVPQQDILASHPGQQIPPIGGIHTLRQPHPTTSRFQQGWRLSRHPQAGASDGTITVKAKAPVLQNISGHAVATPTDKRGFVMSELIQPAFARAGMVFGHGGGYPQGRPHGVIRVLNHHAHPLRFKTWRVASESHHGAKTMTNVTPMARTTAPTTSYTDTTAHQFAPIDTSVNPADFTDSDHAEFQRMALHQAAFNALGRARYELLACRSDYTRAIKQAQTAITAMAALALLDGGTK